MPGSDRALSVVGFPVEGGVPANPLATGLLRRGWDRGVTVFDASRAREPAAAERAIAVALDPPARSELFLATRAPGPGGNRSDARAIAETARAAVRRLGGRRVDLLFVDPPPAGLPSYAAWRACLAKLREEGTIGAWGVDAGVDAEAPLRAIAAIRDGAQGVAVPYNLLERETAESLSAALAGGTAGLFAYDPHAAGALNGRLLRTGLSSAAGQSGPVQWSELRGRLAPVTRLGFLTEERRRTLGQAALWFCLADPRVVTTLPEFDAPQAVDEYTGLDRVPALTEAELTRIRREIPRGATHSERVPLPERASDPPP